jgi:hypothetical protein
MAHTRLRVRVGVRVGQLRQRGRLSRTARDERGPSRLALSCVRRPRSSPRQHTRRIVAGPAVEYDAAAPTYRRGTRDRALGGLTSLAIAGTSRPRSVTAAPWRWRLRGEFALAMALIAAAFIDAEHMPAGPITIGGTCSDTRPGRRITWLDSLFGAAAAASACGCLLVVRYKMLRQARGWASGRLVMLAGHGSGGGARIRPLHGALRASVAAVTLVLVRGKIRSRRPCAGAGADARPGRPGRESFRGGPARDGARRRTHGRAPRSGRSSAWRLSSGCWRATGFAIAWPGGEAGDLPALLDAHVVA